MKEPTCPKGIPWKAHEIQAREGTDDLYLQFLVQGFWVCGHYFAYDRDDKGEA